jgi:hypothetical protein
MEMKRAVRMVMRLIASGIILVGGMNAGLEFMRQRVQEVELNLWRVCLGVLGVVVGLALFAASSSLAEKLTDDSEE